MIFHNVVIENALLPEWMLLAQSEENFKEMEEEFTLHTEERFLPRILVAAGIAQSASEVRRNRPELVRTLTEPDCFEIKWGKKRLFVVVGVNKDDLERIIEASKEA